MLKKQFTPTAQVVMFKRVNSIKPVNYIKCDYFVKLIPIRVHKGVEVVPKQEHNRGRVGKAPRTHNLGVEIKAIVEIDTPEAVLFEVPAVAELLERISEAIGAVARILASGRELGASARFLRNEVDDMFCESAMGLVADVTYFLIHGCQVAVVHQHDVRAVVIVIQVTSSGATHQLDNLVLPIAFFHHKGTCSPRRLHSRRRRVDGGLHWRDVDASRSVGIGDKCERSTDAISCPTVVNKDGCDIHSGRSCVWLHSEAATSIALGVVVNRRHDNTSAVVVAGNGANRGAIITAAVADEPSQVSKRRAEHDARLDSIDTSAGEDYELVALDGAELSVERGIENAHEHVRESAEFCQNLSC